MNLKRLAISLVLMAATPCANAISKSDLLACLRGEQPPSGVVCPVR